MSVQRDNFAKESSMFSVICKLARKLQSDLKPSFSISSALFCALVKSTLPPKPFIFNDWRTFSDNYRGWGCPSAHHLKFYLNFPGRGPFPRRIATSAAQGNSTGRAGALWLGPAWREAGSRRPYE